MTQNRTHTCGELRLSDAGKAVKICGWLENLREVGSELAFAVVRWWRRLPTWWPC